MNKLEQLKENSLKPVGTVFEYEGVKLMVENHNYCSTCEFTFLDCGEIKCLSTERPDKKDVMYIKYTEKTL